VNFYTVSTQVNFAGYPDLFAMPFSPQKAIGSAACAFAIVCTLVLVQQFNLETGLQNPSGEDLRALGPGSIS